MLDWDKEFITTAFKILGNKYTECLIFIISNTNTYGIEINNVEI